MNERQQDFIRALQEEGSVAGACKAVNISRRTAYNWRDADPEYAQAMKDALAAHQKAEESKAAAVAEETASLDTAGETAPADGSISPAKAGEGAQEQPDDEPTILDQKIALWGLDEQLRKLVGEGPARRRAVEREIREAQSARIEFLEQHRAAVLDGDEERIQRLDSALAEQDEHIASLNRRLEVFDSDSVHRQRLLAEDGPHKAVARELDAAAIALTNRLVRETWEAKALLDRLHARYMGVVEGIRQHVGDAEAIIQMIDLARQYLREDERPRYVVPRTPVESQLTFRTPAGRPFWIQELPKLKQPDGSAGDGRNL